MLRPTVSLLIAVLGVAACANATNPTAASLLASVPPSPVSEQSSTPRPSVPPATSAAPTPTPVPEPPPAGRLAYGRFGSSGVTPLTSNTDGTDEQQLLPPSAEGPSWSPNGRLLALALTSPQGLLGTGTVKPNGSDLVRFNSPDGSLNLGCTVWSPDGSRLACEAWDDSDPSRNGMYTVRATDGGDLVRITTPPEDRHDIPGDYTLDGSQIIFARSNPEPDETGDDSHVMVVNLDGSDEHLLSDQQMGGGRLSPDGTSILVASGNYLNILPAGGGQPTPIRIADAPDFSNALGGAWSPDGQWIAFTLYPHNAPHSDIYIMRSDGLDLRQVTDTPNQDEEFADWAPTPSAGITPIDDSCTSEVARCQNMAAGTYETAGTYAFMRGLTVTLPAGWSSAEQDAGEFMLHQASDPDQLNAIFFWRGLVPWVDGAPRPELATTADEFASYLLSDPRLTVVEGPRRAFGVRGPDSIDVIDTVQARSLSVIVSDSAETDADLASECTGEACVDVFIDPDHWGGAATLGRNIAEVPTTGCPCSQAWRLYIASVGDTQDPRMLVIALETAGPHPLESLAAWEAQVEPLIASVLVPSTIIDT